MDRPLLTGTRVQTAVAVVAADEVVRRGLAALVQSAEIADRVRPLHVDEALEMSDWQSVSSVLVDPVDVRRFDDQLAGIAVIEHISTQGPGRAPRLVVVSGVQADDALRLRAAEAGAMGYCERRGLETSLSAVLADPERVDRVPPARNLELLHRLGVTPRSRINRGVEAAFREHLVPAAGRVGPPDRDRVARRLRFNEAARLTPLGADGLLLDRRQEAPSLAQIQRFVAWATQVEGLR